MSDWGLYWSRYFSKKAAENASDPKRAVGRTKDGKVIEKKLWIKTLGYICELVGLSKTDSVLELCCGNGEIIGNLADRCRSAIGIDMSERMITDLESLYGDAVDTVVCDALEYDREANSVDIIIIYFSIQQDRKSVV